MKSGRLLILFAPRQSSAKELKKFQNDVPSTTEWHTAQPTKTPSASSVT